MPQTLEFSLNMYIGVCRKTFSRKVFYTEMAKKKPFKKEILKLCQDINIMSNINTIQITLKFENYH